MDQTFGFQVKCPYCGCGKVFHAEASLEKHIKTYEPVHVECD